MVVKVEEKFEETRQVENNVKCYIVKVTTDIQKRLLSSSILSDNISFI